MTCYDHDYKTRMRAAIVKAIVRESLQESVDGARSARVKMAETLDAAIEALEMFAIRRLPRPSGDGAGARKLEKLQPISVRRVH